MLLSGQEQRGDTKTAVARTANRDVVFGGRNHILHLGVVAVVDHHGGMGILSRNGTPF